MTLTNKDVFYRDPTDTKIPNDGVAKVIRPDTRQQWDVLEWGAQELCLRGRIRPRSRAHPQQLFDQPESGATAGRLGKRFLRQR